MKRCVSAIYEISDMIKLATFHQIKYFRQENNSKLAVLKMNLNKIAIVALNISNLNEIKHNNHAWL